GGDAELTVRVSGEQVLRSLSADAGSVARLCTIARTAGVSIFARAAGRQSRRLFLREFAPSLGYLEDLVCGLGAAAAVVAEGERRRPVRVSSLYGGADAANGTVEVCRSPTGVRIAGEYV